MTEIKIEQKLSKEAIQELQHQRKTGVVHVLSKLPDDGKVSKELIAGKVNLILSLHSKLVVHADILNSFSYGKKDKFRVSKLSDGFAVHPV